MAKVLFTPCDPISVANYVVKLVNKNKLTISNLQLQKVLFFLEGYIETQYHTKLMRGAFTKWKYGPVQTEVYSAFKNYDTFAIKQLASKRQFKRNGGVDFYEPIFNATKVANSYAFEQLALALSQVPFDTLTAMSRKYGNWQRDYHKLFTDKVLVFSPEEIVTCFYKNKNQLERLLLHLDAVDY